MNIWILLATTLVSAVTGYVDKWNLIHFSKSEEELRNCLKRTNLSMVLNHTTDDAELRSFVFNQLADWLHEVTIPAENIKPIATKLAYALGASTLTFEKIHVKPITEAIVSALEGCSDPEDPENEIAFGEKAPPRFVQETPEIAALINSILVKPIFGHACPTVSEYLEFLSHSESSLSHIQTALRIMNNAQKLFKELWNMWNRRARLFYDHDGYSEYLRTYYESNRFEVASSSLLANDVRLENYTVRDPPAPNDTFVYEMTRYRSMNWNSFIITRAFSVLDLEPMTKSQFFFKRQMHQFFQRLFYYLEIVERGLTDGTGCEKWNALYEELRVLQQPLEYGYDAYLKTVQERELRHEFARNSHIFSFLVRSLRRGDQIDEFDLLMMYWQRLRLPKNLDFEAGQSKFRSTTSDTKTTTSSYFVDSSSTSSYDESEKGKGQVTRLPSGKFIPARKHRKNPYGNDNDPSSVKNCRYSESSNDMAEDCYKFSVDLDGIDRSLTFQNNVMKPVKLLQEMFFTMFKSQMRVKEGQSC